MRKSVVLAAVILAGLGAVMAADWPQFLGPDRSGVSAETGLAKSWPKEGPKELWKFPLGVGFGGPAVRDGKVYLLDRVDNKQDVLRCIDLAKGTEDWNFAYDAAGKFSFDGSRSTPTVDDKFVFTVGATGEVYCVDKATRKDVWHKNLFKEYPGSKGPVKPPMWFVSQSPLVYKDTVIVAPQTPKACLAALDKATGKEIWAGEPMGEMKYASPMLTKIDGVEQIVMLTQKGEDDKNIVVFGADPATGKTLWSYTGWTCGIAIPSPTAIGDGRFFITGGYDAGCAMFKVTREGEKWTVKELFKNNDVDSHLHNALLYKGNLYINGNSKQQPKHGLVCMDLDGKVKWATQTKPNFEMGNLVIADGLIYIMDGKTGQLTLAEATPEGYKELGSFKALTGKGETVWAPMAIADGKLLCRDQNELKCFDIKKP